MAKALSAQAHIQLLAEWKIEVVEGSAYATVSIDKHFLQHSLDGMTCEPAEMLNTCGPNWIWENFSIEIEGDQKSPDFEGMEVQQRSVVYRFNLGRVPDTVTVIQVNTTLDISAEDHALVRVFIAANGTMRSFDLNGDSKQVTATYP